MERKGKEGTGSLKERLAERLAGKIGAEEEALLPNGYQQLGSIVLIKLKPLLAARKKEIGEAVLEEAPRAKTVLLQGEIRGKYRKPSVEWIAGERKFEAEHREHGCSFFFDAREIMWSKGNTEERKRIMMLPKKGEVVGDFFAGIGYWSIPIARQGNAEKVHAFEWNPEAFKWLERNIKANSVGEKVNAVLGNCTEEAPKAGAAFDRIILGLIPAPRFALPTALALIKNNGTLHYEGTATDGKPEQLFAEVQEEALKAGTKAFLMNAKKVKDYAPKIAHYTLDVLVKK